MSKKLTKKQHFIRLLKRCTKYGGDKKFTLNLYRKFLQIYNQQGSCTRNELFGYNSPRTVECYTSRGFSLEQAREIVLDIQSRGKRFYREDISKIKERVQKRKNTFDLKSTEEIAKINKLKGKGWDAKYIAKKYNISIEDAAKKVEAMKLQRIASYKEHLKIIGGYKREWSAKCREYYEMCGFTKDEVDQAMRDTHPDTRSIKSIMDRYNCSEEQAIEKQNVVSTKCRNTRSSRSDEYRQATLKKFRRTISLLPEEERKRRLIARTTQLKRYSKSSKTFFDKIVSKLIDYNLDIRYAENEYFLYDRDNKKIYFYDFTIPKLKLIVEYNGICFHPRAENSWCTTVAESIEKDAIKLKLANKYGFELITVWESDNLKSKQAELVEYIMKQNIMKL